MSFNIRDCKPARLDPKLPEVNRLGVDLAALIVDNAAKCKMLANGTAERNKPDRHPNRRAKASYTRASVRIGGRPETPQRAQATARPAPSIRNPLGYA
ncbi:hypothetical protein CCHR01_16154 [Colletotrichum chrysophilum]|uniref:Uncharacterized protein n=1 Tax=Colletotrichum chrysophilum TaxID=1836956 RepID=A0AAD9A6Y3_9PEZI|nr:hypothetical protein CCHR01_16154 [Colletotrichum chrysophilum]